jgi:hypothetical protein
MLSTLTNYNENDGNSEDKSKKIPRWPWIMAAITGLATLYVSSSAQMDNLYRYAVEEISRDQQILQGLQVVLSFCNFWYFTSQIENANAGFGLQVLLRILTNNDRRGREVRQRLAEYGCIEALISVHGRLYERLQELTSKLANQVVCFSI